MGECHLINLVLQLFDMGAVTCGWSCCKVDRTTVDSNCTRRTEYDGKLSSCCHNV